jgi:heme-degrading monooxygenase HmoA
MPTRVMVFATIQAGQEAAFESAYRTVTAAVAGTPGHIRDELLRDRGRPGRYVLLSEWESAEAFHAWETAPIHPELTTPMRPYWAGRVELTVFDVAARRDGTVTEAGA